MTGYILELTYGFRGRMALSAISGILRVATGLIFVALSKHTVDMATGIVSGDIAHCVAGLAACIIIELTCSAIGNRTMEMSEADMKNRLQERLFARLMAADWNGQERYHSGDVLSRLTEDCRVASECLCRTVPTVIITLMQFAGAFVLLWYFNHILAVTIALILPFFLLAGKMFFRKLKRLTRRIRDIESRLQERMQESLQHRILLVTCRQTLRTVDAVKALHRTRLGAVRRRADLTVYSRTAVMAGFESGYLAAFLWGILGLYRGTISFGTMTAYLQLTGQIQRPIADLARLMPGLIQSHTAFARMAEIERMPAEEPSTSGERSADVLPVGIEFRNVTFTYPGAGRPVFSHFSHTFRPGSKTAVMGETGVGKSTLIRLALALLSPQEGRIEVFSEVDGERRHTAVSAATRPLFVYVPQGNTLLSGTIRHNLRLGCPEATQEDMRKALHDAAADFVFDLKYGLETSCGEQGAGLSEGQAQRIAIARGLLTPGSIMLLDEISASLDEDTERLLLRRLSERTGSKTILFVTHRIAAADYCDEILRLDTETSS